MFLQKAIDICRLQVYLYNRLFKYLHRIWTIAYTPEQTLLDEIEIREICREDFVSYSNIIHLAGILNSLSKICEGVRYQ